MSKYNLTLADQLWIIDWNILESKKSFYTQKEKDDIIDNTSYLLREVIKTIE